MNSQQTFLRLFRMVDLTVSVMFVTVAICTFNRAESLRRTLESLAAMGVPDSVGWELIIVNNSSTDHTDSVIEEYRSRLPVRREFEPKPGHSNARNRAVDVAQGEYIVWTDDDVVVDAGWLQAYAEAFHRWPEAAIFGGRIVPRFEPPVPKWLVESLPVLGGPYAVRDFDDHVRPLSVAEEGHLPFGANFAIRTIEQRAFRYDPNLGLTPNRRRISEETDLILRILRSGATGYWLRSPMVEHCIGQERQTLRYIADYCAGYGEASAFRSSTTAAATPFLFGVPQTLWPRLLIRWLRYRFHRLVSPAPVWVRHLQSYTTARGMLRYWRKAKVDL
jgi:glycosyltransferase involved in cell wall biosynthesis